jgi:tetratricopeptide (TPR) repeat protein/transcriptional regulator with XRE-family HTH domain
MRRASMAEQLDGAAAPAGGFGGLLRAYRIRGLLSQERLAEWSGLSARTIRGLETGRVQRPRGESVRLLADALGLHGALREEFEAVAGDGYLAERAGLPPGPVRRPPSGALCQLPPDVADFTGRAEEVALVGDLLADAAPDGRSPAVVVSAVAGKAGVGKTTLAVHVAHQLRRRFPDGQLYVNLRGAEPQPLDPGEALSRLLRALGVDGAAIPADLGERTALYRARLADRRVLVVLDDVASEAQVRPLLPGTAGCGVLATSRARLVGLEGARLLDLEVLPPGQAVELLGRNAGEARVAAEPEAATAIVGYCGRLPLAVRIAGAKLAGRPHWSLDRLAGLLADERSRLDQLTVGDLEVRASVALSYRALTGQQQWAFRLLGLLAVADFAAWTAAALLDITAEQAEELVDGLVQAQLLEVAGRDQTGQVRYRLHDLVRLYARERATVEDPPEQRQAGLARALGGWLTAAEQADQRLPSNLYGAFHGDAPRWYPSATTVEALLADPLAWFEAERVALVAAVDQAADAGLDELAWDLAGSLINFLDLRGYYDDWRRTHQVALAAARWAGNHQGEACLLRGFGYLSVNRDSLSVAMDYFAQALPIHRQVGDRRGEAHALEGIGAVHRLQGRYADAAICLERAITTLVELGDRHGETWTRFQLAVLHAEQGEQITARARLEETLAAFQEVGDRRGEAWTQRRLGIVHAARGNLDRATTCLERALAGLRQLGDRATEALTLRSLGELSLRRHQREKARWLFEECLVVARELDDQFAEAYTLGSLGDLHHLEANQQQAACCLERSAALWRKLDMQLELARTLQRLGDVYLNAGSSASAESAWREALMLLEPVGHPDAKRIASRLQRLLEASSGA